MDIVFRFLLCFVLCWAVEVIAVWLLNILVLEFSLWIYIDEDGIVVFWKMLQIIVITVAFAAVQGPVFYRFYRLSRSRAIVPAILILFNAYWDIAKDKILQPLRNKIADAAEEVKAGLNAMREPGEDTGWANKRRGALWWHAGEDARRKEAGWTAASRKPDSSSMTISLFCVLAVCDALLGWLIVFYTTVLEYDKSIVIK